MNTADLKTNNDKLCSKVLEPLELKCKLQFNLRNIEKLYLDALTITRMSLLSAPSATPVSAEIVFIGDEMAERLHCSVSNSYFIHQRDVFLSEWSLKFCFKSSVKSVVLFGSQEFVAELQRKVGLVGLWFDVYLSVGSTNNDDTALGMLGIAMDENLFYRQRRRRKSTK